MLKATKYDLTNSNIANLGSDLETKARLDAAQFEEQWSDAGKKEGVQIWRVKDFKIEDWPEEEKGVFFSGDSYIVLHTYKKEEAFLFDVYFWLGSHTTQDEAGTAAYKTVELDDVLGGSPVQHREVEGYESDSFLSLFGGSLRCLQGGVDSGFNHVEAESYQPRLLHVKGKKKAVRAVQVELSSSSLNASDVFILDVGLTVYQFAGKNAGIFEKNKAAKISRAIDDERKGQVTINVISEGEDSEEEAKFWEIIGGKVDLEDGPEDEEVLAASFGKKLFRISDADGSLDFEPVEDGWSKDTLCSQDVFVLDSGVAVYAWIGKEASKAEKAKSLHFAQDYLQKSGRPLWLPIVRVLEGGENEEFEAQF